MSGPWGVAGFVLALVVGIAVVQAAIWIPIVLWMRRRQREALARLESELSAETVIRPPEKGVYRGATAAGYSRVSNNGVIALSSTRLVFVTVTGKSIEIPRQAITGVRESRTFNAAARGGRIHLVVQLANGEAGFYVSDNAAWIAAITAG